MTNKSNTRSWYVIHCKSRHEDDVQSHLDSQGIETFYPTIQVNPVNPRAAKVQPYFPGYLFVHVDLAETAISTLQWLPGAIGLVEFDERPAPVADPVIHRLKQQINWRKFAASDVHSHPLKPGPAAVSGAIFDTRLSGEVRVRALLKMLGSTAGRTARVTVRLGSSDQNNTGASRKRAN